jgi:glycosyltransferase involved in cell wall biosynthesis
MSAVDFGRVAAVGPPAEVIGTPPDRTCAVTVLVETYNHEDFIGPCLEGILAQRFSQPFRVVIHDDASTDATPQIVREIAAANPGRVLAILQQENQLSQDNPQFIPNLDALVTPYVAFCEGDDRWIDDVKLERQWRFMQRSPWCAISHHDVEIDAIDSAAGYASELRRYLRARRPDRERTSGLALMDGNWIMTCSVMIRTSAIPRDVVRVMGGREPSDYILFALAAQNGDIGYLPDVMSSYRLHGSNFWSTIPLDERAAYELETLWFLAAHLSGAARERIRHRLVEALSNQPDDIAYRPFLRMREEDRGLVHDRDVLLDRVRYLEEREIELVHALGWDAGDQ